jgi:O-antigen/teichoic acid export membrane protein
VRNLITLFTSFLDSQGATNTKELIQLLVIRFSGLIFYFGITFLITNSFPVQFVGEYEYVRPILVLLGGAVLIGFDRSALFYAGTENSGNMARIYVTMFLIVLLFSLLLIAVVLFIPDQWLNYLGDGADGAMLIVKTVLSLCCYAILILNISYFRAFNRNLQAELYIGFFQPIAFAIGVLILIIGLDYRFLVDVFLLSHVPLAVLTTYLVVKNLDFTQASMGPKTMQMIRHSIPMAVSAIGFSMLFAIDILLLKIYSTTEQIAIYSMPLKFVFLLHFIPTTISSAVSKSISEYHHDGDRTGMDRAIKTHNRLILLIALLPILLCLTFSDDLLSLFGVLYKDGDTVLKIFMLATFINLSCGLNVTYFSMTGKQIVLQFMVITAVILNLLLNLWLIPAYGIVGAAWSYTAAIFFLNLVTVVYAYQKDRIWLVTH